MTDEPSLQETNKEIRCHIFTSLPAFLNLHDSQFVLKVSHFVFKSSSYVEIIKSYCPVQAHSYLLNPISPGTFERSIPGGVDSTLPLFFSAFLADMRPKIGRNVNNHVNNETKSSKSNHRCCCCC